MKSIIFGRFSADFLLIFCWISWSILTQGVLPASKISLWKQDWRGTHCVFHIWCPLCSWPFYWKCRDYGELPLKWWFSIEQVAISCEISCTRAQPQTPSMGKRSRRDSESWAGVSTKMMNFVSKKRGILYLKTRNCVSKQWWIWQRPVFSSSSLPTRARFILEMMDFIYSKWWISHSKWWTLHSKWWTLRSKWWICTQGLWVGWPHVIRSAWCRGVGFIRA